MTSPIKPALKPTPQFTTEQAERAYWEQQDSTEHIDWSAAQKAAFPTNVARAGRTTLSPNVPNLRRLSRMNEETEQAERDDGQSWDRFFMGSPAASNDFLRERASQQQSERESL